MNSFACILVLSVLVTVISGQPATRCEKTPPKWAGMMREIDYDNGFFRFADVVYSESEQSIYVREFEDEGRDQRPTVKEEWFDYAAEMKYNRTVNRGSYGPCMATRLSNSFRPFGVPPNAVFTGREYLGAEVTGLGLEVDVFIDRLEGGIYHGSWVPAPETFNAMYCVPVLESYLRRGARFSESRNLHSEFINITVSFPAPPKHCTPTKIVY